MACTIAVDTVQLVPGESNALCPVMQDRINSGWTLYHLFNIDVHSYTVVYLIWSKDDVVKEIKPKASRVR